MPCKVVDTASEMQVNGVSLHRVSPSNKGDSEYKSNGTLLNEMDIGSPIIDYIT